MLSLLHKGCLLAVALFAGGDTAECASGDGFGDGHRGSAFTAVATELAPMACKDDKRQALPDAEGFACLAGGGMEKIFASGEAAVEGRTGAMPSLALPGEDLPRGPPSGNRELVI